MNILAILYKKRKDKEKLHRMTDHDTKYKSDDTMTSMK